MNTALQVDHYGQDDPEGRQQTNNTVAQNSHASAEPWMADTGYNDQQYVDDGNLFTAGSESAYNFKALHGTPSDRRPTTVTQTLDQMHGHYTGGLQYSAANNYQPDALSGIGTQFSQVPQWTGTGPGPSAHPRFSGYASHIDTSIGQTIPSLQNSLLNTAAPDHIVSGEHTNRLLQRPGPRLERLNYGEGPAADLGPAPNETPSTVFTDIQDENAHAGPNQDPLGCSVENTAYTDRSGWWYSGYHDGWCRIPHEHRHNYDGGVYFSSYSSFTQNIYDEQNDHITGFLLGLCHQLQTQQLEGAPMCLHQSCEEARRVAQQLVDTCLPEAHGLRQGPLSQPHPVVIRLLHDLNDRLPEGYVYDPISQRVVQYELPNMGGSLFRDELANLVEVDAGQENDGQQTR